MKEHIILLLWYIILHKMDGPVCDEVWFVRLKEKAYKHDRPTV